MRRLLLAISRWEWLLLLLLIPLFLLPTTERAVLLLLIPLLWLVRRLATGRFFPSTPFNVILFVMGLAILVSLAAVFDLDVSLPKITALILGIALFFAAIEHMILLDTGTYWILGAVLAAGTAAAAAAPFFTSLASPLGGLRGLTNLLLPQYSALPGASGGVINANELAGVLVWIVPLFAAVTFGYGGRLWHSERWLSRFLLLALLAGMTLNTVVLVATRSRGGLFATGMALLIMIALRSRIGPWLLIGGIFGGTLLVLYAGLTQFLPQLSTASDSLDLSGRLAIWARGIQALGDMPITGVSMNGFRHIVHVLYPFVDISATKDIGHAHNHLLQAGLDLGVGGLVAYLAIWIVAAVLLWQVLRTNARAGRPWRALQIGLAGSLVGGWLFGILDAIALGARPGFIWWLILALVIGVTVVKGDELEAGEDARTAV